MKFDDFISIAFAAETLADLKTPLSVDALRALIDDGKLSCAVYWLTQNCWLYVDPQEAVHHEVMGWPQFAACRPEDLRIDEANLDPKFIYFTDERDHPNLCDRFGLGGQLNLAKFRQGLFVPKAEVIALAKQQAAVEKPDQPMLVQAATWPLREPQRWQGYNRPLYEYLKSARDNGKPCPKPDEILQCWKSSPPPGYGIEVSPNRREFSYQGYGSIPRKTAGARDLGRAIKRMTSVA